MMVAVVIPDPFQDGRFLLCMKNQFGWTTAVSSHGDEASAERERRKLQAQFDLEAARPPFDPDQPAQLVLGFYTDEDAA